MDQRLSRRRVVQLSSAGALAALAGCGGNGSGGTETTTDDGGEAADAVETEATPTTTETQTPTTTETETETETPETAETDTASDGSVTPHGDVHAHGSMVVEINGETYTLSDEPWNYERNSGGPHFHFHPGDDQYHLHAAGVTFEYALDSLPRVEASSETFEFRGQTYDANADGTQIRYVAGGEEVGLDHVIPDSAPDLRVVVETDAPTPAPVTTSSTTTTSTGS